MSRALLAAAFGCCAAGMAQPMEGTIALTRFGTRGEIVAPMMVEEGGGFVPLVVPAGKVLTIRQVTATCGLGYGTPMNFWTIRSSADSRTHHYLPIGKTAYEFSSTWVASERVRVPVKAGGRPVATFQRTSTFGGVNDACVGSWSGELRDAPVEGGAR